MNQNSIRSISLISLALLFFISISTSCSQDNKGPPLEPTALEKPVVNPDILETTVATIPAAVTEPANTPEPLPATETSVASPVKKPVAETMTAPAKPSTTSIKPDGSVDLKPGQSVQISSSMRLDYVRLVNDSRCPAGVQCVWAGEVTIELLLDTGSEKQSFNLIDNKNTATVLGMQVELVSIDRAHKASLKITKI